MADRKSINIQIKLDGKAEFKTELDKLIKESGANNLKFDTSSAIKSLNEFSKVLNDVGKKIQGSFNTSQINSEVQAINKATEAQKKYNSTKTSNNPKTESVTKVFKDYGDGEGNKQIQTVTKLNNGLGQTVKLTQDLIDNTTTTSDTTNYKKQSDSIDKMNERVLKLIQSMNLMKDTNLFDKSVFNNNKGKGYLDELKGLDKNIDVSNIDKATASVSRLEQKSKDMAKNSKRIVEVTKSFEALKDLKLSDNFAKLDEAQVKQYNDQLKSTTDLLKKLKGNSGSVNDISYSQGLSGLKDTTKDLSSSIKEIDKYGDTIDKLKSKLQGGVNKLQANDFLDESVIKDVQNRLNSINTNSSEEEVKQLAQEIKNLGSSDGQIVRVQASLSKMKSGLDSMQGKYKGLVGDKDSIAQLEKYNSEIKKLEGLLRDLQSGKTFTGAKISSELNEASEASRNLSNAVKNSSSALKLSQQDAQSFGSSIKKALANIGMFTSVYQVIRLTTKAIKEGVQYVKYLDDSFTDMAMTMNITKEGFNGMSAQVDTMAKKLGVTSQYVHDIARVYANANSSIEEIMQKVEGASQLANISGMNGLETTKAVQSITNQFKLMEDASANAGDVTSHVGDVLTAVSKNMKYDFAGGIKELNEAISTSGSVAEMSGVSLESYTATVGALIQQTGKSGNEIANAYKMISARVLQIKSVAEDAGVNDEEMSKAQKALDRLGISIEDTTTGSLRNLDDILKDVGAKWGNMTDVEKQYTSEMLAGNRQRSESLRM